MPSYLDLSYAVTESNVTWDCSERCRLRRTEQRHSSRAGESREQRELWFFTVTYINFMTE